ncbi:uncharacterized protein LOC122573697 [Bombus pyrosoma]|uniref:uncharacterized protein LOC122573697 n=1 Tax=Bombus pyrosoma TaxID=396416 RepID=UPI001CB9BD88|nr:uncharacterized protein LOC122573697 [Bombus pyrosoma]
MTETTRDRNRRGCNRETERIKTNNFPRAVDSSGQFIRHYFDLSKYTAAWRFGSRESLEIRPTLCNVLTLTITINLVSPGNARTGGFCSLTPTLFQKFPSLQTQKLENCFVFCLVIDHLVISVLNNFNTFYLFDSFPSNK